ncbi:hypothetical protein BV898_05707 [Hypsibius exemplaris]|uniref:F-box domain-containing protein n=1 Tax=Hypsibius exemplaris TaxID=2072580 RepID=A0A1W0WYY7_HYPEX|nr:hypothetical protein BV898_05707 [Hypsibius exemplaris]
MTRRYGSAKIHGKLHYCQEQYRIWKGLVHHYSPLWATDGFISSLNDLPLCSLEDILLFTGTISQARVRRVCRRWGAIVSMSYISKCLNVEVPDIWTTISSAKIPVLSKGLSVMVTEHTHTITFIRPSVHPSVSQFDDEFLIKLAGIAEEIQVNASCRSPWALTLNWDDWNQCDGFSEDISGIRAAIWQDIEVITLVEIFVLKVLRDVRYKPKTHAMDVVMEYSGGGAPNVSLITIIMTVYTKKKDRVHGIFVRSLKVLL